MRKRREHFGAVKVIVSRGTILSMDGASYPTMEGAIEALDEFNNHTYWPLRNVVPYLGRMGVE